MDKNIGTTSEVVPFRAEAQRDTLDDLTTRASRRQATLLCSGSVGSGSRLERPGKSQRLAHRATHSAVGR